MTRPSLSELVQQEPRILRPWMADGQVLPGLWPDMFPKALRNLQFPRERAATCMDCPKVKSDNFRRDYRCCTYHPRLPNFMLGLASLTPTGEAAIKRGAKLGMLLPIGLEASPQQWLASLADEAENCYGQSQRVLCPMLDTQTELCGVYAFRNAVCSSYFCLHDHGRTGAAFWQELQTLGSQLEILLAQAALRAVGFPLEASHAQLDAMAPRITELSRRETGGWTEEALAAIWGSWFGRERQLYQDCAAYILDNKERLWTLASRQELHRAERYEQALDQLVPDPELWEIEEEPERFDLEASWQLCMQTYATLWLWPQGAQLCLHPKVRFAPILAESGFYEVWNPEGEDEYPYRIDQDEKLMLESFAAPGRPLTPELFRDFPQFEEDDIRRFIGAMICRMILDTTA